MSDRMKRFLVRKMSPGPNSSISPHSRQQPGPHPLQPPTSQNGASSSQNPASASQQSIASGSTTGPSRSAKRKAKKRRNRRHSFIDVPPEQGQEDLSVQPVVHPSERRSPIVDRHEFSSNTQTVQTPRLVRNNSSRSRVNAMGGSTSNLAQDRGHYNPNSSLYSLGMTARRSNESLDSQELLDHRLDDGGGPVQSRRKSLGYFGTGSGIINTAVGEDTPLLGRRSGERGREREDKSPMEGARGMLAQAFGMKPNNSRGSSVASSLRRREREREGMLRTRTGSSLQVPQMDSWDVNNPPSRPGSPIMTPMESHRRSFAGDDRAMLGDTVIDFDGIQRVPTDDDSITEPNTPGLPGNLKRRMTIAAAEDVCFPQDILSEIAEEEEMDIPMAHHLQDPYLLRTSTSTGPDSSSGRTAAAKEHQNIRERRPGTDRFGNWPDLNMLEAWSAEEKEERAFEAASGTLERTRKIQEPIMVDGRLRPLKNKFWSREVLDQPYRFTYFNEEFDSTIHSQTISELVQEGQSFRDLFVMEPALMDDSDVEEDEGGGSSRGDGDAHRTDTSRSTPISPRGGSPAHGSRSRRYGPRPVFWLDVLSPTQAEMGILAKAFGIHRLTVEDIMLQEAREKVELFKHYYFVNYRSFEQDRNSEEYMEPVNISVVVFPEGILSFHFSQTPHPANVRRRIRQLSDYMLPSTDWISFAIIDDVTDAYIPLIQAIEEEVDTIDEAILGMHSGTDEKHHNNSSNRADMLRHVGDCRKKVMGLYRLMSNKADVIKGFAKRCNEQWSVAPKTEIGLYLGDIQDHIVTMTANLGHYENLLSRAHSNYLAQINIRMNERAERTNDVLGTLTILGTIVLPMNIVTGLWGMNTRVPGEEGTDLTWFYGITGSLLAFGIFFFIICRNFLGLI